MSFDVVTKIVEEAGLYNIKQGAKRLQIILHGGEPLLWGKENFLKLYEFECEFLKKHDGFKIQNSLQSNGYLIDDEWIEIFKKMDVHLGLSIDGPVDYNFHYGREGKEKSLEKVLENTRKLRENNLIFGMLSVVTESHLGHAKEYMDFLHENKLYNPGFCFCYNPRDDYSICPERLAEFVCDAFDIYYHSDRPYRIREFDNIIKGIYGKQAGTCTTKCRQDCGTFVTTSPDGKVGFCDAYEKDSLVVGNIKTETFESIIAGEAYQKAKELYMTAKEHACKDCDFLQICGCGCARVDQGEGIERKNYFCEANKILIKHIINVLANEENLEKENEYMLPLIKKYIVEK